MIVYLKGPITEKSHTHIVVEAGGVGYRVHISLYTYSRIEKEDQVKILTHLHIKEDSHTLFGFFEEAERSLFILLLSVSGIGPNTARVMLSTMSPEEIRAAIIGEDVVAFNKVKGVGPKTAKRIILDLKDKVLKTAGDMSATMPMGSNTLRDEALSALLALGFNKIQVQKTLNNVLKQQTEPGTVEELIKMALKQLS